MTLFSVTAIQCGHVVGHTAVASIYQPISDTILLCGACAFDLYAERAAAVAAHQPESENQADYKPEACDQARANVRRATLKVANFEHNTAMLAEAYKQGRQAGTASSGEVAKSKKKTVSFAENSIVVGVSALLATIQMDAAAGTDAGAGAGANTDLDDNDTGQDMEPPAMECRVS